MPRPKGPSVHNTRELRARIEEALAEQGKTYAWLAQELEVTAPPITDMMSGKTQNTPLLWHACRKLGIDLPEIRVPARVAYALELLDVLHGNLDEREWKALLGDIEARAAKFLE